MIKGELELIKWNRDGDKVFSHRQPMRSFVRQMIDFLAMYADQVNTNMQDITDTTRLIVANSNIREMNLIVGGGGHSYSEVGATAYNELMTDGVGIQIGTGNTAPTSDDYAIETRCVHGQAATQMVYGGEEIEPIVVSAPSASFLIRRYFNNKSGGGITVAEVGIYVPGVTAGGTYSIMIARDVLGAPVVVADTELLRVQYTISVTV